VIALQRITGVSIGWTSASDPCSYDFAKLASGTVAGIT